MRYFEHYSIGHQYNVVLVNAL